MPFDMVVRVLLAAFFTIVALSYAFRGMGAHARRKRALIHGGEPGTPERFLRSTFNVFRVAIWTVCVWRVVDPGIDPLLFPFGALNATWIQALGLLAMAGSFAGVEYVHAYMGEEWRSGVPRPDAMVENLLQQGPFALVRNPMFIAVALGQVGLFLALPGVFTALCLVVGLLVLRSQVRIEERALAATFGPVWSDYAARVARWRIAAPRDIRYRVDAPSARQADARERRRA